LQCDFGPEGSDEPEIDRTVKGTKVLFKLATGKRREPPGTTDVKINVKSQLVKRQNKKIH